MGSTGNPELDAVLRPELKPVRNIGRDVDRYLALLRSLIRGRGFTQVEVQAVLGWGRTYISQLLVKQKALRLEQVLLILGVIGVEPDAFFAELYHFPSSDWSPVGAATALLRGRQQAPQLPRAAIYRLPVVLDGLVSLLKEKGILTTAELSHAIEQARREPADG